MNWNDDSLRQCAVCNDVQTFALLSDGCVLKRKIQLHKSTFLNINWGT